jgi:3-methyladenine DNA glycosylase/8-oxoguanine DNA glycosylase
MPNPPLTIRLRHSPAFAAQSHGWCYLAPFSIDGDCLNWAVRLPKGDARRVTIRWSDRSDAVRVAVPGRKIGEADREFLRSRIRWMFRADEDFTEFWELCQGHGILRHAKSKRTGALLRCATVFEDVVKTICTTNCSWRNTKLMVANVCRMFGEPCPGDGEAFTFPTPERLAAVTVEDLRAAKLGFRARYIHELAKRVGGSDLDLDMWCRESDADALRTALLGIKGIGSYGANHLLMLLGHYGNIPCDSEVREYLGLRPKRRRRKSSGWRRNDTGIGADLPTSPTSSSGCSSSGTTWTMRMGRGGEVELASANRKYRAMCSRTPRMSGISTPRHAQMSRAGVSG